MGNRLTLEIVKERLEVINPSITILSDEYVNSKTKMKCVCGVCKDEWQAMWNTLGIGTGCPSCYGNKKITIEAAREYVNSNSDCKLLSKTYKDNRTNMDFECGCGKKFSKCFSDFKLKRKMCLDCSFKKSGSLKKITDTEIKSFAKSKGDKISKTYWGTTTTRVHVTDEEGYKYDMCFLNYRNNGLGTKFGLRNKFYEYNMMLLFKKEIPSYTMVKVVLGNKDPYVSVWCDKGHLYEANFHTLRKGGRCRECYLEDNQGIDHPNYNPLLTDEERMARRSQLHKKNQRIWARNVNKNHNDRCVICSSTKNISAHHLEAWNIAKHLRFSVSNGVTLCREHHTDFHKKYGYGNNTKIQFDEYLKTFAVEGVGKKESILL